jgi:hypothetical protein
MGPNWLKSTGNYALELKDKRRIKYSESLQIREIRGREAGGADRDRTGDLLTASQGLISC